MSIVLEKINKYLNDESTDWVKKAKKYPMSKDTHRIAKEVHLETKFDKLNKKFGGSVKLAGGNDKKLINLLMKDVKKLKTIKDLIDFEFFVVHQVSKKILKDEFDVYPVLDAISDRGVSLFGDKYIKATTKM